VIEMRRIFPQHTRARRRFVDAVVNGHGAFAPKRHSNGVLDRSGADHRDQPSANSDLPQAIDHILSESIDIGGSATRHQSKYATAIFDGSLFQDTGQRGVPGNVEFILRGRRDREGSVHCGARSS
jgi:hypothetical protein